MSDDPDDATDDPVDAGGRSLRPSPTQRSLTRPIRDSPTAARSSSGKAGSASLARAHAAGIG